MSETVDNYLAHYGIEVDDEIRHYGVKGMKWGVRKSGSSGGSSGNRWTDDQKKKARNVAIVAGSVAVGAAFVAAHVYANGADARKLAAIRAPGGRLPAGAVKLGASLPSQKGVATPIPKGFFKDVLPGGKIQRAAREGVMSDAMRKTETGKRMASEFLKKNEGRRITIDPELRKFIKDAPERILKDQKGWSESLGKSLNSIQKEDAAFMVDFIKKNAPKALGA